MVIPFMTVYLTQHLHFSITQAGLVMACFGTGAILGAFIGGRLVDKIGFYPVQFWSLLLNGLLLLLLGQMRTMAQISICIFVLSMIGDALRPANAAAIAHYSLPENRTRSISLSRLAANLGFSIGPAVGGILAGISYQLLFWVDGLTCIIAAVMLRIFLPPGNAIRPKRSTHADVHTTPQHSVYKDTIYLTFIALVILNGISFFQMLTIVPVYFKEVLHINEAHIGLILGLNGLLIALVEMVLVYKLEGRRESLAYICRGILLMALAYLSFNLLPGNAAMAVLFMLIISFAEMMSFPFMNSFWISRSREHNTGQYAALYAIAFSAALILAPSLGAYMVQHIGFSNWWYVTAGLCLVSAGGFAMLLRKVKQDRISVRSPARNLR